MNKKYNKLQTYSWRGLNKNGIPMKGKQIGLNTESVLTQLKQQGISATKISKHFKFFTFKQKCNVQDIVLFTRSLATLLSAGIPLTEGIAIIIKCVTKKSAQTLFFSINSDLLNGLNFFTALKKHAKYFNNLFCNLIRVGEESGTLSQTLVRLADYLEKNAQLRKKFIKSMYYPLTVLFSSLGMSILLITFIVPHFSNLFNEFGGQLPLFTRCFISLSLCFQKYGHILVSGMLVFVLLINKLIKNSKTIGLVFDMCLLKLPLYGKLIQTIITARLARTLSTSLAAGLPLIDALTYLEPTANNRIYSNALRQIKEEVKTGIKLHTALSRTQLFPSMMVQMMEVGEEAGKMHTMLDKVANFYEEEFASFIESISSMMEPLIIIILSVVVGCFVLAMYLPIFQLGSLL